MAIITDKKMHKKLTSFDINLNNSFPDKSNDLERQSRFVARYMHAISGIKRVVGQFIS